MVVSGEVADKAQNAEPCATDRITTGAANELAHASARDLELFLEQPFLSEQPFLPDQPFFLNGHFFPNNHFLLNSHFLRGDVGRRARIDASIAHLRQPGAGAASFARAVFAALRPAGSVWDAGTDVGHL